MKYTQYLIWSTKIWSPNFFPFCEKFYHQNLAKSFLRAQILILGFSIVYPWKIGNFLYRMAYSKPENSKSNYSKIAFKECKELWRGLYIREIAWHNFLLSLKMRHTTSLIVWLKYGVAQSLFKKKFLILPLNLLFSMGSPNVNIGKKGNIQALQGVPFHSFILWAGSMPLIQAI